MPIIKGAIIEPNTIPNLNHRMFNGVNSFEFIRPKIKKIIAIIIDQNLGMPSYISGHKDMIKKTTKKTKPKLRFELVLTLDFRSIIY